jgi:hypothetical protein
LWDTSLASGYIHSYFQNSLKLGEFFVHFARNLHWKKNSYEAILILSVSPTGRRRTTLVSFSSHTATLLEIPSQTKLLPRRITATAVRVPCPTLIPVGLWNWTLRIQIYKLPLLLIQPHPPSQLVPAVPAPTTTGPGWGFAVRPWPRWSAPTASPPWSRGSSPLPRWVDASVLLFICSLMTFSCDR